MYGRITQLNEEEMKKQESGYIYRYRYNGGGATQVWLSSGRYSCLNIHFWISCDHISQLWNRSFQRFQILGFRMKRALFVDNSKTVC